MSRGSRYSFAVTVLDPNSPHTVKIGERTVTPLNANPSTDSTARIRDVAVNADMHLRIPADLPPGTYPLTTSTGTTRDCSTLTVL